MTTWAALPSQSRGPSATATVFPCLSIRKLDGVGRPDEVEIAERLSDTPTNGDEDCQRDAGREAPMSALRSPTLRLDAEPCLLDCAFCLAVRMASSGRPGPGGLDEILQSGAPWHARTDMLEHA